MLHMLASTPMETSARTKTIWVLGVLGVVVSWMEFARWTSRNGPNVIDGWIEAFTASLWANGLLYDLVTCTVMVVTVAVWDRRRLGTGWVLAVIGTTLLALSLGLACYLVALHRSTAQAAPKGG